MADASRIPAKFALFNAYINATTDWLFAMSGGVVNWERLGLTASEATLWSTFRNTWNSYYAKYSNPDLVSTAVRDNLKSGRRDFKLFAEPLLDIIAGKKSATVDDYLTFRIKRGVLRDTNPTPVPLPTTYPVVISINVNEPMEHIIRFKDQLGGGRAKPFGVRFCEIIWIVRDSENPPDSLDDCDHGIVTGRSPVIIHHTVADQEKRAYYFLRWINNRGVTGPWSPQYHALIV